MKRGFLHRRFIAPIVALLTQGITPEKIALSLAFGIVLGIFRSPVQRPCCAQPQP